VANTWLAKIEGEQPNKERYHFLTYCSTSYNLNKHNIEETAVNKELHNLVNSCWYRRHSTTWDYEKILESHKYYTCILQWNCIIPTDEAAHKKIPQHYYFQKAKYFLKIFFLKFWLWKRTIVTEKKLRVGGPAYQPLSCATFQFSYDVTSHSNLLRHSHTSTCYVTLTPTCYVTLTSQLAVSHSHPNLLRHTVSATSCFTEGHTPPYLLLS
jgi:hypothetical protein